MNDQMSKAKDMASNARDAAANAKDDVTSALWSEFEKLKAGFAELQGDLSARASETYKTVEKGAKKAKHWSEDQLEVVEDKITENPVISVAIAAGVGYLVAKLMAPKRR